MPALITYLGHTAGQGPDMAIRSVYILSKAGSLIFRRDYGRGLKQLEDTNDYLVFASSFHTVYAWTSQISPVPGKCSGLQTLEMPEVTLHCFQSITGVRFLVITDPNQPNIDEINAHIYLLYSDYVMKNPFYTLEMPIRCAKFDAHMKSFAERTM